MRWLLGNSNESNNLVAARTLYVTGEMGVGPTCDGTALWALHSDWSTCGHDVFLLANFLFYRPTERINPRSICTFAAN